jgi:hypothetical protein
MAVSALVHDTFGVVSHPSRCSWGQLYTFSRIVRALGGRFSALGRSVLSGTGKTAAESLPVHYPFGSDWVCAIVHLLSGGRGMDHPGMTWADGRGSVGTEVRFVPHDDCSSAELTIIPLGSMERFVESNPDCLQESPGHAWAMTALGWLEPKRHRSGLARWTGGDHAAIGVYACISWWSQLGNADDRPFGASGMHRRIKQTRPVFRTDGLDRVMTALGWPTLTKHGSGLWMGRGRSCDQWRMRGACCWRSFRMVVCAPIPSGRRGRAVVPVPSSEWV